MNDMPSFSGVPGEGLTFLAELSHNNNRDWFEAHKGDYRSYLLEPAQAFVIALGERLKLIEVCFEHCRNMAPLHRWLVQVNESARS